MMSSCCLSCPCVRLLNSERQCRGVNNIYRESILRKHLQCIQACWVLFQWVLFGWEVYYWDLHLAVDEHGCYIGYWLPVHDVVRRQSLREGWGCSVYACPGARVLTSRRVIFPYIDSSVVADMNLVVSTRRSGTIIPWRSRSFASVVKRCKNNPLYVRYGPGRLGVEWQLMPMRTIEWRQYCHDRI
jgi:hypothetical protein